MQRVLVRPQGGSDCHHVRRHLNPYQFRSGTGSSSIMCNSAEAALDFGGTWYALYMYITGAHTGNHNHRHRTICATFSASSNIT
jgi:hypothetical protein